MKTWILILQIAIFGGLASEQKTEPPRNVEADISKMAIESRAERIVESTRLPPIADVSEGKAEEVRFDRPKIAIESSAESLVETSSDPSPPSDPDVAEAPSDPAARVIPDKPGLVNWHQDFTTARDASQVSGKPILLFQLLGNLDEHFT